MPALFSVYPAASIEVEPRPQAIGLTPQSSVFGSTLPEHSPRAKVNLCQPLAPEPLEDVFFLAYCGVKPCRPPMLSQE